MSQRGQSPRSAAVYARLSTEDTDALAVSRQREDCLGRAEAEGWQVVAEFTEDRASAYSGKRRPEFERLLEAMRAGEFDALLVWKLDRLSRNLSDYARAHDAAEDGGVRIVGVRDGVDTGQPAGEFTANVLFAVARQSSRDTSVRVARRAEQSAKAGRPGGGPRPLGWQRDRVTPDPTEAAAIREAADRLLAGESLRSIAYSLGDRVASPQTGRPLSTEGWRDVLRNPRVAGLRRHRSSDGGEALYDGQWPALIDRDKWEQVTARLASNGDAKPGRPAERLLSGLLTCGRCGQPMVSSADDQGHRRYICLKRPGAQGCGRITVGAASVEAEVRDRVLAALSTEGLSEAVDEPDDRAGEAARELAAAEDRLDELASMFAEGEIGRREWKAGRERAEQRIDQARQTLEAQAKANVLAGLPDGEAKLRQAWEAGAVDWRRSVIRAVVESVTIDPAKRRGGPFDPDRVAVRWRV